MRQARSIVAWVLGVVLVVGCDVAELPNTGDTKTDTRDASDTRDTRDTKDSEADSGDGLVSCDPRATPTGCPTGQFCESTAKVCVECVGLTERCVGDPATARRETCEAPVASGVGALTGGFFVDNPCGSDEVCVPRSTVSVTCQPKVCEAGFAVCLSGSQTRACNASGTAEVTVTCDPGRACYDGKCEFIRHNVVLVFDTSSSMWSYTDPAYANQSAILCEQNQTPCMPAFPECDGNDPMTIFTLSKDVFSSTIDQALGGFSQFALMRFPQLEAPRAGVSCFNGWYASQEEMTGDDDHRTTDGGTWFAEHLGESVVVPFPVRTSLDNRETLLSWLDHRELLGATQTVCNVDDDCGPLGRCGVIDAQKRCFVHSDEELRAIGQTPLGKTLFYAGEYLRTKVRVDGKACTTDASCDSSGYVCRNEKCVDPYRKCKSDYIILFTDGEESVNQEETSFFNPVVQAKRLAFGLDCESDTDCRGGATCQDKVCLAPTQIGASMPNLPGDGYGALASVDGQPISIQTTVITLNQSIARNARIALAGGGPNIVVSTTDPATFKFELRRAMTPNPKCTPDDLD